MSTYHLYQDQGNHMCHREKSLRLPTPPNKTSKEIIGKNMSRTTRVKIHPTTNGGGKVRHQIHRGKGFR